MRKKIKSRNFPAHGMKGRNVKKYFPEGRALHLIDIENLMGGPSNGPDRLRWALAIYRRIARVTESDHKVIGTNPALLPIVYDCWPSARVVTRIGPEGADIRLIETVRHPKWTAERYDRLVIGSGDGHFTEVARVYRERGLVVDVVTRRTSLSSRLAAAATRVRTLPEAELSPAA